MRRRVAQIVASTADLEDLYVSDASDSHAFVYKADGSFEYVRDFEFSELESNLGSGHREILAVKFALSSDPDQFRHEQPKKLYWQTDSRNCFNFLLRGSRRPKIQRDVFIIKKMEKALNVLIIPVWTPREQARLVLADLGSKFSNSTDEWAIDRSQLMQVFETLHCWPTVDAFAASHNHICENFYSLLPQLNSAGVNFFAQTLSTVEVYFCCPPVKLIVPCFKFLVSKVGIQAILMVPEWTSAPHWPFLFNGVAWREHITEIDTVQARFFYTNNASSSVFTRKPKFRMLALKIQVS